jgi:UDP-2-acetamido-2,6-beta-L-arabino-hexul-4-ose reductase
MSGDVRTMTVTGANGFVGRNLCLRLAEQGYDVVPVTRETSEAELRAAVTRSDVLFHLAGANRPPTDAGYMADNRDYAARVADAVAASGRSPLVVLASSVRAAGDDEYGRSKSAGEDAMLAIAGRATVSGWRLPNLFGKWARPNYNSVVATFAYNLAHGLPLTIHDPAAKLSLLYIDDLIDQWLELLERGAETGLAEPTGVHHTTVGELASTLTAMAEKREAREILNVGSGFERALYATYLSYLRPDRFRYGLPAHSDSRGAFAEVLRTPDCGQMSVLVVNPGQTRGGHYHHTKVEKFIVVKGRARFRFRQVISGETAELLASGERLEAIETIPGWTHDITSIGEEEVVALLWASEAFDPARPDTVSSPL